MNFTLLSPAEEDIMHALWAYNGEYTITELIEAVNRETGKNSKRSTIVTFLERLLHKQFVSTRRAGRYTCVRAIISEEDYKSRLAAYHTELLFDGSAVNYLAALQKSRPFSEEEKQELRRLLDD